MSNELFLLGHHGREREREAKTASFAQNGKLDNPSQEMR